MSVSIVSPRKSLSYRLVHFVRHVIPLFDGMIIYPCSVICYSGDIAATARLIYRYDILL